VGLEIWLKKESIVRTLLKQLEIIVDDVNDFLAFMTTSSLTDAKLKNTKRALVRMSALWIISTQPYSCCTIPTGVVGKCLHIGVFSQFVVVTIKHRITK
jgi:hypothetical protein